MCIENRGKPINLYREEQKIKRTKIKYKTLLVNHKRELNIQGGKGGFPRLRINGNRSGSLESWEHHENPGSTMKISGVTRESRAYHGNSGSTKSAFSPFLVF
jgi:hypothetical protein